MEAVLSGHTGYFLFHQRRTVAVLAKRQEFFRNLDLARARNYLAVVGGNPKLAVFRKLVEELIELIHPEFDDACQELHVPRSRVAHVVGKTYDQAVEHLVVRGESKGVVTAAEGDVM